ncbi:MAG: hypothetical protein Kapaf2KO_22120 [Candidatus Kapaibacteriales bacterium]
MKAPKPNNNNAILVSNWLLETKKYTKKGDITILDSDTIFGNENKKLPSVYF